MKKIYRIILGLLLALVSRVGISQAETIEQVHGQPTTDAPSDDSKLMNQPNNEEQQEHDYQKKILSNKDISDIARTKAMTGNGGNTATVIQNGANNHSDVIQSGNDNYSSQTQKGSSNTIRLNQQGNNNRSDEKQIGKYKKKVIIQNGNKKETIIIDQVDRAPSTTDH